MTSPETPDPTPDHDAAIKTAELVAWYNQEVDELRQQQAELPDSREEAAVNPTAQRMAGFILGKTATLQSFQALIRATSTDIEAALKSITDNEGGV